MTVTVGSVKVERSIIETKQIALREFSMDDLSSSIVRSGNNAILSQCI